MGEGKNGGSYRGVEILTQHYLSVMCAPICAYRDKCCGKTPERTHIWSGRLGFEPRTSRMQYELAT
jgi:hypothetical protein